MISKWRGGKKARGQDGKKGGITMALMRWRDRGWPFGELNELRREMDRLFERAFGRTTPERSQIRCPN